MNVGGDLCFVKQRKSRCMLGCHSFIKVRSNFFAEPKNNFLTLEESVSLWYSQWNGYGHDILLSIIYIINCFLKSRPGFLNFTLDISDKGISLFFAAGWSWVHGVCHVTPLTRCQQHPFVTIWSVSRYCHMSPGAKTAPSSKSSILRINKIINQGSIDCIWQVASYT